jgi:hypothetical protein
MVGHRQMSETAQTEILAASIAPSVSESGGGYGQKGVDFQRYWAIARTIEFAPSDKARFSGRNCTPCSFAPNRKQGPTVCVIAALVDGQSHRGRLGRAPASAGDRHGVGARARAGDSPATVTAGSTATP